MDKKLHLRSLVLLIGLISHGASSQSFQIPNGGDSCNVVSLNFGRDDGMTEQTRGPQGPPGKRGIMGMKGTKGSRGEVGPIGITSEMNAELARTVIRALGATSCDELMKIHGMREAGHYLTRSNNDKRPLYTYCDFQLREGIRSCRQLRSTLGEEMNSGFYLMNDSNSGDQNFRYCQKDTPKDCKTVNRKDAIVMDDTGGVFDIFPLSEEHNVRVYCDLETDGGGWTVFQRRMDGSVDFYRGWNDYVNGFGKQDGEFWLGLKKLHEITSTGDHELRIDLKDWSGNSVHAKYRTFSIGRRDYRLDVGSYTGTAGDSLSYHDNMQFSTKNADRDQSSSNCAQSHHGAWWYKNCHHSNLNGKYHRGPGVGANGVVWYHWKNSHIYLKFVEMKVRGRE